MSLSAILRLSTAMLAAGAAEPNTATVVFTGVSLVFLILLILIVVILIQGKIFTALDKKKKDKEAQETTKQAAAPVAAPAPAAQQPAPAPAVEQGIPPEVVAAIVAAVSAATGGEYTLRSVTTAKRGRGSWGLAGVIQSTEPF